jgi:ABC-type uncharacterized transport system auxiliary subunit
MKRYGALFLLATLASCKLLPDAKSADIKYLSVDPGDLPKADKPYAARLSLRPFTAPKRYGHEIVIRTSPYQIEYQEETRWVEPPAELAYSAVEKLLRSSELFKPSENDPEWQLEGKVLCFDEVKEQGAMSAECTLQFEIFRRRGGEKIWAQTITAKAAIEKDKNLPEGMSKALREIGEKMVAALVQANLK